MLCLCNHEVKFQKIKSHIFQEIERTIRRLKVVFQEIKSFNNICQSFDQEVDTIGHFCWRSKVENPL